MNNLAETKAKKSHGKNKVIEKGTLCYEAR
jgi:hypothetical protein